MKKWVKMRSLVLLASGCLAAGPVTCNSITAKSKSAQDDGYSYVTVTGSMVSQRVKKGETPITASPVSSMGVTDFSASHLGLQAGSRSGGGP